MSHSTEPIKPAVFSLAEESPAGGVTELVPRANIDSLTGLRFVAALTIALGHTDAILGILTLIGMPLFFTLSGFVIHYVYSEEFSRNWRTAIPEFALARFSRIYPLYFCLFLFTLISTPLGDYLYHHAGNGLILTYIGFVSTWLPFAADGKLLGNWYYAISWSIPTEMFFYVAYALVLHRISRIKTFRTCLLTLVAFCILSYLWFYILFISRDIWEPLALSWNSNWVARTQDFGNSFYRWFLYFSPYSRIFEFIGGCLTCQLFFLARNRPPIPVVILELLSWFAVGAIALVLIYIGIATEPWLSVGNTFWHAFVANLHMNFLLAPMCYILFFSFSAGSTSLGRLLGLGVPRFLGEISYSIYLGHPVAAAFVYLFIGMSNDLIRVPVTIGLILLLAWALYTTVEVPSKRWLRTLGSRYLSRSQPTLPGEPAGSVAAVPVQPASPG
jgi:peptidoglycan/LPS O-acetylase OafA/YrhL